MLPYGFCPVSDWSDGAAGSGTSGMDGTVGVNGVACAVGAAEDVGAAGTFMSGVGAA